jgi:hypothetical protein
MDKLTNVEQSQLDECETTIEHTLGAFYETGEALQKIRDERLYRATHVTFEKYCQDRWGIARRTAYQYIDAAKVIDNVRNCAQIPTTESQARELAFLNPEEQRKVWEQAIEMAPDGHITAAHIRETRESLIKSPEQETLFTEAEYRQAITDHVTAANQHRSASNYHVRQAIQLRDEACSKFEVQIELPFNFDLGD